MNTSRSTISFTKENWQAIEKSPNKSKTVNLALNFFFKSQEMLKKKEEEFILNEIAHYQDANEHYSFKETFE